MAKTTWKLDPAHCEVEFRVKHMMVSTVTGRFTRFDGTIESDGDDFEGAKGAMTIDVASISTGQEARDKHLNSDDFFNSEKFPKIRFESTSHQKTGGKDAYSLKGNLTIRDVTRPIELKAEFGGVVKDPYGNHRAGIFITGKINRKDFNLKWNALLETGGAVVADEVAISASLEFTHPA